MDEKLDFSQILNSMSVGSASGDPIKAIYEILPTLDNVQQDLLFKAYFFINKYDLQDCRQFIDDFVLMMSKNKNLGMLGSKVLRDLLSAYTQNEYLRGIKVNTVNDVSNNSGV